MRVWSVAYHVNRVVVVIVALLLIISVLTPSLGGNSISAPPAGYSAWAFAVLHPVAMILGWVLLTNFGITAYVVDAVPALARKFPDRAARRLCHASINMFAFSTVIVGYLLHFSFSAANGKAHFAGGSDAWRQAHVWIGTFALIGMAAQVGIGFYKYVVRTRDGKSVYRWHGYFGLFIWTLACVAIGISSYGTFWVNGGQRGLTIAIWLLLFVLVGSAFTMMILDPSRGGVPSTRTVMTRFGVSTDTGDMFDGPRESMGSLNSKPLLRGLQ